MANINRDYLIVLDAKSSVITEADNLMYYIVDEHSPNLFVNLVVRDTTKLNQYVEVHDPANYKLELHIVKPNNDIVNPPLQGTLLSADDAIYSFVLPKEATDYIGSYKCELRVIYQETEETTITTSNKFKYRVKKSIYNNLDGIVNAPEYPLVIQLFDKLSDINQYEEDRRGNELARQLAEEQRQARFDALDADMVDSIQAMDDKVVEVENRITAKEEAVDKLVTDTKADIDEYKVAKDQEIDEYKAAKDTEINNAITNQNNKIDEAITTQNNIITQAIANQDTKIDTAITAQNDKIEAVQNNDAVQNNKLDTLQNKATIHEGRITATEVKNTEQDNRLDIAENRLNNIGNDITNTMQPIIDAHTSRLDAIEAIDIAQNTRLDAIEIKNQQQDDRLSDVEKVNKRQDMDLKCLFTESKNNMIDVTEEGNSIYLQNSTVGYALIDEIQGNTMVNCNKEPDKEIILNGNINTQGYSDVTLTEGVDGGLVDVALEGNTMVNVCDQKDPVAITKSYTVETGNHVALQGEYDGKCRPVVTGNTLWIDNDTEDVLTAFDATKNLRLQSSFEDKLVTQEMVDNGEELAENLGKYRVDYKSHNNYFSSDYEPVNYYIDASGNRQPVTDSKGKYKTTIKINPNTTYKSITSISSNLAHARYCEYTSDGTFVVRNLHSSSSRDFTFTTSSTTAYIDVYYEKQLYNNIVLVYGEVYKEYTKTLYLNSPLLEGDTIEQQGDNVVHVHRSELRAYETDDELTLPTDMTNTLVAKATPQYEVISQNDTILCDSYVNGHLDVDSIVPIERVNFLHFEEELTYLYPSTQYAVQFVSDAVSKVDITLGGAKLLNQDVAVGLNKISITTPETLADNKLIIDGVGTNISEVVVTPATDQDFEYFEGMKSVGECEDLEVVSSNSDGTLSNTQTLTHEPLRGVGDYRDRYVLIDGKWYIERNCKEVVFDGSDDEYWEKEEARFSISISNVIPNRFSKAINNALFTTDSLVTDDQYDSYAIINGWGGINKLYLRDINKFTTLAGLKQYLQQNPVTVVYELATPQYEPIDYNPFTVYSDVAHISNNSTIPCNMTIKNTGYNCLLKPSTTYTVSSNLGLNVVTTPSVLTEDYLRFYDTDTSTVTKMNNVTILEGDYTTNGKPIPSHFSGIESAFEQEYDEEVGKYKVKIRVQNEDASKENNITFYIDEPLRGVGDVKDRVYIKDDKVVVERNCGTEVFDGSDDEEWREYSDVNNRLPNVIGFFTEVADIEYKSATKNILCDGLPTYVYDEKNTEGCKLGASPHIHIYVSRAKLQTQDEVGFKQWLQQNPTTIVYQLAEPVYEEVEYNDIKLFIESFKNSTLFYNSNVPVTSKVYYSYSVPIVDTVAALSAQADKQEATYISILDEEVNK